MKRSAFLIVLLVFACLAVVAGDVIAHPGATDANGCHTDGRGRYHCH